MESISRFRTFDVIVDVLFLYATFRVFGRMCCLFDVKLILFDVLE